jgi:cell surface protein SprA
MSFWGFRTAFQRMSTDSGSNYQYKIFDNMIKYRNQMIENQLTSGNEKYIKNSQDILIPAFFAAYSGKADRARIGFNPFNPNNRKINLPLPNWRIDYSGLANLEPFKRIFSSITINHSYTSNFNVGNYTSSLEYNKTDIAINLAQKGYPLPSTDALNSLGQFIPVFVMSTITIDEKFAPFIGIQFVTKSKISGKFEYNKERRASLNLSNSQIAEYSSDDFVFNFGFRKNGVKLPFRGRDGSVITLKNDLNVQFNLTLRDIKGIQRRLDGDPQPTQGNYNFQVGPRISYQINKRILMNFYIDHLVNRPFVTNFSFPRTTTTGGLNVRFSLSE